MSGYRSYGQPGYQTPNNGPTGPPQEPQLDGQWRPPVAPSPGYQQGGTPYGQGPPGGQQGQYGGTPYNGYPIQGGTPQESGYFPPQGQPGGNNEGAMGGLSSQMGGMGLGDDAATANKPQRKKNRHAYHNLDQPAQSQQNLGGMQQGYLSPNPMSPGMGNPLQYAGQQITAAMNQFPAQAGTPMTPGVPSVSTNFGVPNQSMPASSGPGVSAQGRVDPEQVPSIPFARDAAARYYLDHTYPTIDQHLPPPATIPFVAYDQGNSSPKYARLTLNHIPSTAEALAASGLPLGIVLQPLAPRQEGEDQVPVLDFGETGPPRCRRCRTYINPFMSFKSGGNKFVCNMCTFPNDVAPEYFAPTDPSGVRVDRTQRPELTLGTVEFTVPKEYWAKEPVGLRWLFLIDVSQEAINRGFLEAFCNGILKALYENDEEDSEYEKVDGDNSATKRSIPVGSKVGFVTYDKAMHYYNCSANLDQAQMLVMPDVEEPFVPLGSDGLFVDLYESKAVITSLLQRIPTLFVDIKMPEPALLPTIDSALSALSATGGKIICSLSTLPTWGPGRLIQRDEGKLHGIETEKKLFQTEHPGWKKTAGKMVESGVGIDFFIASASGGYMDLATIGHASAATGGEMYFYPNYIWPRDNERLSLELKHTLTRDTGYQALMKVRCSNGLQVSSYHGNFLQHTFGADLEFGVMDADKAVGVMFSYDGKLDSKLDAHFQCALLYTTARGERRVRCTNTVASVSEGASMDSMRYIDQDAVVSMIAREGNAPVPSDVNEADRGEATSRMTERTLKDIRNALTEKTVDILAGYRKTFSVGHPPGQLVLPENLKEFSMYMLSLIKSRALKAGSEPSDRRVHVMRMIKSMSPTELSLFLYPRIISVHNLAPEDCFPNESGHLQVPSCIRATFSQIEEGGVYIVDDGQVCLLWLHAQVSPNLIEDLFGPDMTSLQALDPMRSSLPVLETHLNAQVRNLLAYLASVRGSKALTVQLTRQGLDGSEYEFARLLCEDRNNEAQSYVDWLVHVHRAVQMELSGQRKKDDGSEGGGVMESTMAGIANLRPPW